MCTSELESLRNWDRLFVFPIKWAVGFSFATVSANRESGIPNLFTLKGDCVILRGPLWRTGYRLHAHQPYRPFRPDCAAWSGNLQFIIPGAPRAHDASERRDDRIPIVNRVPAQYIVRAPIGDNSRSRTASNQEEQHSHQKPNWRRANTRTRCDLRHVGFERLHIEEGSGRRGCLKKDIRRVGKNNASLNCLLVCLRLRSIAG